MIIERKPGPGPELQLHRERNGVGGAENPRLITSRALQHLLTRLKKGKCA